MNGLLPYHLEALLGRLGLHERLPLVDAGFDTHPVGWARVAVSGRLDIDRFRAPGLRCTPARRGARDFVLVRTEEGDRLEIDVARHAGGVDELAEFVEAFDRATQARRSSNAIACWTAASDAIIALLRIAASALGIERSIEALPRVREAVPKHLREAQRELSASLNLRETLGEMRQTLAYARGIAQWLGSPTGAALATEADALQSTLDTHRFWNLRDVATWWAPHVRRGVLWRGRPPASYADDGFWEYASAAGLRRFVDLRGATERLELAYPDDFVGCASCPLGGDPRVGGLGARNLDESYLGLPAKSPTAIAAVLTAVAEADGPTLVHCRAGVDRTGVLIAIIGLWLGVGEERIVADYLASGQLVQERRLRMALGRARELGVDTLVANSGASQAVLAAARRRLLA